jgi:hypothetical protein
VSQDVDVRKLICFEASDDGFSIRIRVEDAIGRPALLSFPIECITSLMMTLPSMTATAIQRRQNNPKARITYPLAHFEIELTADPETRILTLKTPDGFTVSFSLSESQCRRIGALTLQVPAEPAGPSRFN